MKYNNYFKIDVALLMFSIWSYVMSNAWMCIFFVVAFVCFGVYVFFFFFMIGICASEV